MCHAGIQKLSPRSLICATASLREAKKFTRFIWEFLSAVSKGIVGNFIRPLVSRDALHLRLTSSLWLRRDEISDKSAEEFSGVGLLGAG